MATPIHVDRDWMAMLGQLDCVLCEHLGQLQVGRTFLHHVREGQGKGQRASDYVATALCHECHQGTAGWHGLGKRLFYLRYKLDEMDLLAMTLAQLHRRIAP